MNSTKRSYEAAVNHLSHADRERLLDRLDELADLGRLMRQPGLLGDAVEAAPRKAPDAE